MSASQRTRRAIYRAVRLVRLFTDDRATRSGGQAGLRLRAIKLGQRVTLGPPARCHCPSSVSLRRKLTLAGPDQRRLSENVYGMVLDEAGAMSGSGPWPTTPARTGTGPVTGVLRSSANECDRRDHSEDWGRHAAHSLPNATQMHHETGKPLHIKGLFRILIPPFPGSNPAAPATQSDLPLTLLRYPENGAVARYFAASCIGSLRSEPPAAGSCIKALGGWLKRWPQRLCLSGWVGA
jgi:hypothetical protein